MKTKLGISAGLLGGGCVLSRLGWRVDAGDFGGWLYPAL